MTNKTEKIIGIEERIAQLENRKKQLVQKQKTDERKARTKRLIERGAILESLIEGAGELTNDQIAHILKCTVGSSYGDKIVTQTKSKVSNTTIQGEEIPKTETE